MNMSCRAQDLFRSADRVGPVVPFDREDSILVQLLALAFDYFDDPTLHDRNAIHKLLKAVADPEAKVSTPNGHAKDPLATQPEQ